MIDGVVITTFKTLEAELRKTQAGMENTSYIAEQDVKLERSGRKLREEMQRGQRDAASGARSVDTKDGAP